MINFRSANVEHLDLYYSWVIDPLVRSHSLNSQMINYEDHVRWFNEKLKNPDVFMYIFFNELDDAIGQVRIERKNDWAAIGQSIDIKHRGKKYSTTMLQMATDDFLEKNPIDTIVSVVKNENIASIKMAKNSGFHLIEDLDTPGLTYVCKGHKMYSKEYIIKIKDFFDH